MSDGDLNGKVVRADFWPACSNCARYAQCRAGEPHHPAFSHRWHWGREAVRFDDGTMLVLRSWVGSTHIGMPYTGCTEYRVAESVLLEMQEHHRRYLELERERLEIEARLETYERCDTYNGHVAGLYDRLEEIDKEQIALTEVQDATVL